MRIAGIAACVPTERIPNDPKVAAATGIPARLVAPDGVSALDLCLVAARRVLADTGARPEDFGAILAVSFTQQRMPSLAAQAQAKLGFPKGVLAFDVLQACAGWGYGLYLAALLVRETGKEVLLLDGDRQSAFLDANDPATSPLLSDGGTATVVEREIIELSNNRIIESGEGPDVRHAAWKFSFLTDGEKGDALKLETGGAIQMDGFGVFRFVATDVVKFLKEFSGEVGGEGRGKREEGRSVEVSSFPLVGQHDKNASATTLLPSSFFLLPSLFFVPHQPNVYMVRQLAKAVGLEDRVLISADRFGNLASASVPATIAAQAEALRTASEPPRILFAGFGGGLAISAGLVDLPRDCRLSVVEVPEKWYNSRP